MSISSFLTKSLGELSEENYDRTFSVYRFWIGVGAAHRDMPNDKLYNDILNSVKPDSIQASNSELSQSNARPDWVNPFAGERIESDVLPGEWNVFSGRLIHDNVHLLLRFINDAEPDPVLSTYAIGLHDRWCRESLGRFFGSSLSHLPGGGAYVNSSSFCVFYTTVNLIAHWVNLGCVKLEDVRDRILQSLTFQPTVYPHQLNSLMILLKISGATFAAYVDPSVMDRCCDLLKPSNLGNNKLVATSLAEVRTLVLRIKIYYEYRGLQEILRLRESGWEGLPSPPILHSEKPKPKFQDSAATPVATSLGLPSVGEQPQTPVLLSSAPEIPPDSSSKSSAPPSPSISDTALSDFTIADSLDDEAILEPEIITPHDMFYLDDGSVEVVCGKTIFRVHPGALSFHSPVLRKMFSSANLTAAESPGGCPRIVSSDTPADFVTLLKVVYLPEYVSRLVIKYSLIHACVFRFPERNKVPDFSTFSSLLRISTSYEMPNLRTRLFETVRGAYPENFEGLDPSKVLGENVFEAPKPHPNAVLNFFIQQKVTSALPMAYYMAARRGLDSLMDTRLPSSATLSGQTLRFAVRGLVALREMELKEMHRIAFAVKDSTNRVGCSSKNCPTRHSQRSSDPEIVGAHQRAFDRMSRSAVGGTRILQVLSVGDFVEDTESKFCQVCAEKMQVVHAEVRRKAWAALPEVFGLRA